jgi:hypothetical protein
MDIDLSALVDKALYDYDKRSIQYKKYIDSDNIIFDRTITSIKFVDINQEVFNYNILGVFDNINHIWMWAWMVPDFLMTETVFVKKLLNYGLKIDSTVSNKVSQDRLSQDRLSQDRLSQDRLSQDRLSQDRLYLKTQLVNSRFLLEDNFQLELHLAISYYLSKENIKFIYPRIKYLSSDKKRFITVYYLIT